MKQTEFLNSLKIELERNRVANIEEILSDYREHFEHGRRSQKTDEEISLKLGNPATIAKAYEADTWLAQARSENSKVDFGTLLKALGRFLLIAPFNFLMLFIPGLVLVSILISGWASALALSAASLFIIGLATKISVFALGTWAAIASISLSLGVLGLSILLGMLMYLVSKFVFLMVLNYIHWNIQFVMEK